MTLNLVNSGNTEDIKSENELLLATQLQNEILGCDMLWSLFVAAARSYRFTSILHPFPPMYSTNNEEEKNMFGLVIILNTNYTFVTSSSIFVLYHRHTYWIICYTNIPIKLLFKKKYLTKT